MIRLFDETGELGSLENLTDKIVPVVNKIMSDYKRNVGYVNIVFIDDEALLQINRDFLRHDYYTDIITFNYSDDLEMIEGELYISLPRIKENASEHDVSIEEELYRVIIHGHLHLVGLNDRTEGEKNIMQQLENQYINLICST